MNTSSATAAAILSPGQRSQTPEMCDVVRWREMMLARHDRGATRFVAVGPGRVLTGPAERTLHDVELIHA